MSIGRVVLAFGLSIYFAEAQGPTPSGPSPTPTPTPLSGGKIDTVTYEGSFQMTTGSSIEPSVIDTAVKYALKKKLTASVYLVSVHASSLSQKTVGLPGLNVAGKRRLAQTYWIKYWVKIGKDDNVQTHLELDTLCNKKTENILATQVGQGTVGVDTFNCELKKAAAVEKGNQCAVSPKKFRAAPLYLAKKKQIIGFEEDTSFCPETFPTTFESFKNTVAAAAAITTPPQGMAGSRTLSIENFNLDFSSDDFHCIHENHEVKMRVRNTMQNPVEIKLDNTYCYLKDISIYNTGAGASTFEYGRDGGMMGLRLDFDCLGVTHFGKKSHVPTKASINMKFEEESFLESQQADSPDFTSFFKAVCTTGGRKTYFKPGLLNKGKTCFAKEANALHVFSLTSCFKDFLWIDLLDGKNQLASIKAQHEVLKSMFPPETPVLWKDSKCIPPPAATCPTTCTIKSSFAVYNTGLSKMQVEEASKQALSEVLGASVTSVFAKWIVKSIHSMYWAVSYDMVENLAKMDLAVKTKMMNTDTFQKAFIDKLAKLPASMNPSLAKAQATTIGHVREPIIDVAPPQTPSAVKEVVPANVMADRVCVCLHQMECDSKCDCSNVPPAGTKPLPWFSKPLQNPSSAFAGGGFDLS